MATRRSGAAACKGCGVAKVQRELAQWHDALAFDSEHGERGPDEMARRVERLRKAGRVDEMNWWLDVGAKLIRLYEVRAEPAQ